MNLLKEFLKVLESFFPDLSGKLYVDKLPTDLKGSGVLLSEKAAVSQVPAFNNKPTTYEKRTISIYLYSPDNQVRESREVIYAIYEKLREYPKWPMELDATGIIDGIYPENPIFIGETNNQKMVYNIQFTCYYHK